MNSRHVTMYVFFLCIVQFEGSCATTRTLDCEIEEPILKDADEVPSVADLDSSLALILESLCKCEFSLDARSRIPLGLEGRGSWLVDPKKHCLGPIRVHQWSLEGDHLMAIELVQIGKSPRVRSNLYVMFANLIDGKWLFSWPAGTGPPLHP